MKAMTINAMMVEKDFSAPLTSGGQRETYVIYMDHEEWKRHEIAITGNWTEILRSLMVMTRNEQYVFEYVMWININDHEAWPNTKYQTIRFTCDPRKDPIKLATDLDMWPCQ